MWYAVITIAVYRDTDVCARVWLSRSLVHSILPIRRINSPICNSSGGMRRFAAEECKRCEDRTEPTLLPLNKLTTR